MNEKDLRKIVAEELSNALAPLRATLDHQLREIDELKRTLSKRGDGQSYISREMEVLGKSETRGDNRAHLELSSSLSNTNVQIESSLQDTSEATSLTGRHSRNIINRLKKFETFDTDTRVVFVVDILYVFFTMIATILVSNLLVVYFPQSEVIAPEENNNSSGYMNLVAQPVALVCIQIPFFLWMCTRAFIRKRVHRLEVLDSVPALFQDYIRSKSFLLDAFMTIPLEAVFIGTRPEAFAIFVSKHFLRWGRCVSLSHSSNPLMPTRIWYLFFLMTFALMTFVHVAAVVYPMIEGAAGNHSPIPLSYVTSLYFIVTTVTSVGYGDVVPTQSYSRSFIIIVEIVGIFGYAGLTAFGAHYLTARDIELEEVRRVKMGIIRMLKFYDVPWRYQKEVLLSVEGVLSHQSETSYGPLLDSLPIHLSQKVQIFQRARLLRNVHIFNKIPQELLLNLSAKMRRRFVPAFQKITSIGEAGHELFIIVRGKVEVWNADLNGELQLTSTLRSQHYFGIGALVDETIRAATVTSVVDCELLVLSRKDFIRERDESLELAGTSACARVTVIESLRQSPQLRSLQQYLRGHPATSKFKSELARASLSAVMEPTGTAEPFLITVDMPISLLAE